MKPLKSSVALNLMQGNLVPDPVLSSSLLLEDKMWRQKFEYVDELKIIATKENFIQRQPQIHHDLDKISSII